MSNLVKAMLAKSPVSGAVAVDDVFSTYVYEGNGSTQTITNGIDLAVEGGMTWIKRRNSTNEHVLFDTLRGAGYYLESNTTDAESVQDLTTLSAFNSDGFDLGGSANVTNSSAGEYVSWTFRKAPKFFDVQTISHINGVQTDVDVTDLGEVGFVTIKQTNSTSDWFTWHKDLTAGNNLKLNEIDAESSTNAYVSVSGTTISFSSSAPSGDYVVYAWAHDSDTDSGVIQCGSYTGNISKNEIPLDWEAQYVLIKRIDTSGYQWYLADNIRGMPTVSSADDTLHLRPDNNIAEQALGDVYPTATGFTIDNGNASINAIDGTYIYMAIRRSEVTPTSGSEVFAPYAWDGSSNNPAFTPGFITDLAIDRQPSSVINTTLSSRLTGDAVLITDNNASQGNQVQYVWDYMNGFYSGSRSGYQAWMFKRAPGFMDVVCYTGDGAAGKTVDHNLKVPPEMMIVKTRSVNGWDWAVYHSFLGAGKRINLNTSGTPNSSPSAQYWNNTTPTDSVFTVAGSGQTGASGFDYIAILFATLAGISKVGSYTGNGTSQNIDCGFSAGARFILIKRTDSTGDWWFWDSLRGISAGNDPALKLNDVASQVSIDAVDPYAQGFAVNQEATTNINVNSAEYIFLAIA